MLEDLRAEVEATFAMLSGQTSGLAYTGGYHIERAPDTSDRKASKAAWMAQWRKDNPKLQRRRNIRDCSKYRARKRKLKGRLK